MENRKQVNRDMIIRVARILEPLLDRIVFVGGVVAGLIITDEGAPDVRPTVDVDIVADVSSKAEFWKLEGFLRELGLTQSSEDKVICRWRIEDMTVDFIPTDSSVLGFSNPWYKDAFNASIEIELEEGIAVRMITAPYFLATKIAAFEGRGKLDFLASHDMEDIITVIDGRSEIVDEIRDSDEKLKRFLSKVFQTYLEKPEFMESLPGKLPGDVASQARLPILVDRLRQIGSLS